MINKILIVDDDKEFRDEFRTFFREYDVVQASTGEEALEILRKPNEISLVILDVKMPGMGGTETLARIKALTPEQKTVILTGYGSKEVAIKALKCRADDFIEKPFHPSEMREVVDRLLNHTRPTRGGDAEDLNAKIRRVKEFVERNVCKKISLEDAAKTISFCPKYLSRVFKEVTGMGFGEYRIAVQMDKAKEFLASREYNVNQISDKLGYQNPESFIRQFKRSVGCTPTEYRAKTPPPNKKK